MVINHNIAALNTYRQFGNANKAQSSSMEKLSSGLRINKAGDDAAGLAISEKMRGQIRGLDQASRNAQDGISMVQTAEGALAETQSILQRQRELAVQASNDTNTGDDRNEIQKEIGQLNAEIDRISSTTEFNTQKLLNGSLGSTGASSNAANVAVVSTTGLNAGKYDVKITLAAQKANTEAASNAADADVATAAAGTGKVVINGITIDTTGVSTVAQLTTAINAVKDKTGVEVTAGANGSAKMKLEATTYGSAAKIDLAGTGTDWLASTVLGNAGALATVTAGVDATATVENKQTSVTSALTGVGQKIVYGSAEFTAVGALNATATITVATAGVSFQIGANKDQTMLVDVNQMDTTTLGNTTNKIKDINVLTTATAETAIKTVDDAIKQVSSERSKLGAFQNRLDHTTNNLNTSSENLTAAESRIRDVDMAKEMMEQTKNSILSQAAQAMLAQANQAPQQVLQLLK